MKKIDNSLLDRANGTFNKNKSVIEAAEENLEQEADGKLVTSSDIFKKVKTEVQ